MTDLSGVGHHFIIGLSGPVLSELDIEILKTLKPAGILLLKRNFVQDAPYKEWLSALGSLLSSAKKLTGREKMVISLDHEGGRVHRTPPPITHFPEAVKYCQYAFEVGKAMAWELRSIGVNVSWAPVCDIHSNPNNPVISSRAFGTDAQTVADAASQFARGLLEHGVAACAKHFPGHGDTSVDSHKELPTLTRSLNELKTRELIPFKRLIDEGIPMIMTSHIVFPAIDPGKPATLSKKILKNLLRDGLGFQGIIVTDDLDMKAVADHHSDHSLAVEALQAGCELFIVARHPDGASKKPLTMAKALHDACKDAATQRISGAARDKIDYFLQHALGSYNVTELQPEVFGAHAKIVGKR